MSQLQEPYDYYEFGQRYVRNLIDFDNSVLGHPEIFDAMEAQLAAGENVVLLANHQTEADPAVSHYTLRHNTRCKPSCSRRGGGQHGVAGEPPDGSRPRGGLTLWTERLLVVLHMFSIAADVPPGRCRRHL